MNDHCRGALIGLAVGDALGAAVEFKRPGSFAPVAGYRGGGPHGLSAGEWTDDTSMALALADSIGKAGWDLNDQASRYVEWWKTGKYSVNGRCFDIGMATRTALAAFAATKGVRQHLLRWTRERNGLFPPALRDGIVILQGDAEQLNTVLDRLPVPGTIPA